MNEFLRSIRALEADDPRGALLGMAVVAIVLAVWMAWFMFARVTLYEVTDAARLEVDRSVHALEATVSGRVVSSTLVLDREVRAGDVLVELDARSQELELDEARSRLAATGLQLEALQREIAAKERSLDESELGSLAALDEAREARIQAESLADLAEKEAERAATLHASGAISEAELNRKQTEARRLRAAARSRAQAVTRLDREQGASASDRVADLQRSKRELDSLRGDRANLESSIQRLLLEIDKRRIRAPFDGKLGEMVDLSVGQVIQEGQTVGAVVPSGALRVVAEFEPATALGRIRRGQSGRVRLEGFPWTQFGTVAVRVETVASEVRDGHIRVELAVLADSTSRIPLQHGLPGAVEIEVDRVSPASLVLRAAGRMMSPPARDDAAQPLSSRIR